MNNLKCSKCGLVNFATTKVCARCKTVLSFTDNKNSRETMKLLLPLISLNGCGIILFDQKQLGNQLYSATRWISIVCVPIIPLSTIVFSPVEYKNDVITHTLSLSIYENYLPDIPGILKVYASVIIGIVPIPLALYFAPIIRSDLGFVPTLIAIFGSIIWALIIIIKMQNDQIDYNSYKN